MSASSYRRVSQRESDTEDTPQEQLTANTATGNTVPSTTTTRSRGERLEDKCTALAWVIVAILVDRWTEFFGVLWWHNELLNRTLLRIAFGGFLVVVSLFLYLTLYLPRIKGLSDPSVWGVYCPRVMPSMCLTGLATYVVFVRALWPLWGFKAPLVSGIEIMGMLMALHFVPTFGLC